MVETDCGNRCRCIIQDLDLIFGLKDFSLLMCSCPIAQSFVLSECSVEILSYEEYIIILISVIYKYILIVSG